jgi:AcrR family transcriptional regulator
MQLLALGVGLFSERSYDDVAIDEIAARAGVSRGLLYHYFPSKRDFYVETVRWAAEQMQAEVEPEDETLAPIDRLREGLDRYLGFVERHAQAYATVLRSGIGSDAEVLAIVEATRAGITSRLLEGVGLATPRPHFRTAIRGWIGMVEGASLDWLDHRDVRRADLVEVLAAALAAAIGAAVTLDPGAGVPPR